MENRIDFHLTEAEQAQLKQHLDGILAILNPQAVTLSDDDRKTLAKMSDGTQPFVEKALGFMQTAPDFKPAFVNTTDAQTDLNAYKLAKQYVTQARDIVRILEDISMLSGSEAYTAALAYYKSVQFHDKQNQAGAKAVANELSLRFVKSGKPTAKIPSPPIS